MFNIKPDVKKLRKEEDIPGLIELLDYRPEITFTDRETANFYSQALWHDNREFLYEELPLSINSQILATCDEVIDVRMEAAKALIDIGEKAVEPLIHKMKQGGEMVVWILGELGDPRAVEPLIEALKNGDSDLQEEAKNALTKIGEPAVDPLIKTLNNESCPFRCKIKEILEEIGEPAVPHLLQALKSEEKLIQSLAAELLGTLGGEKVLEPLLAALGDGDANVRANAAWALGEIGGEKVLEPLLAALGDGDANVRANAVRALGEIRYSKAVEPLSKALKDEKPLVRRFAVEALAKIADSKAFQALLSAMEDEDYEVRKDAVYALEKFGKLAVEPLIKVAMNTKSDIRLPSVKVLEKIEDPRIVEFFFQLLEEEKDSSEDTLIIKEMAAEALANLGEERAVKALIHILIHATKSRDLSLEEEVAKALAKMGQQASKPLIQALRNEEIFENVDTRETILSILAEMEQFWELIMDAVRSEDWHMRRVAVHALSWLKHTKVEIRVTDNKIIDLAMQALRDSQLQVRMEVIKTLREIGDQRAVEALANILANDEPEVRAEAAKTLRKIGEEVLHQTWRISGWIREKFLEKLRNEKILKPLLDAATDRNADVRGAAIWALGVWGEDERVMPLIIKATRDEERYVRLRAVDSIYSRYRRNYPMLETLPGMREKVVEILVPALRDEYWRVREKAVAILGSLNDKKVVEHITRATRDEYLQVRRKARKALREILYEEY